MFFIVGIFLFPDEFIKHRIINQYLVSGNFPEIMQILTDIVNNEEAIKNESIMIHAQNEWGESALKTITLLDVFQVIKHDNYPFLWEMTVKALTIMPTTVSCEQQFSQLRHKLHYNMAKETSFAFMWMTRNGILFRFDKT